MLGQPGVLLHTQLQNMLNLVSKEGWEKKQHWFPISHILWIFLYLLLSYPLFKLTYEPTDQENREINFSPKILTEQRGNDSELPK